MSRWTFLVKTFSEWTVFPSIFDFRGENCEILDKKTCQGCYTFLLRVQRNDKWKELISRNNYYSILRITSVKKKFYYRRRSFTNVVSDSFYVFRGKLPGKQVVLEKHTNLHQFWILKQNSIRISQKKLKTMSTLTFTCRVERSIRKKPFIVFEIFRFFWIVAAVWRKKIEKFCENAMAGLPKPHFTCPEERFSGKQIVFLGKLFCFQFLIVKERLWLLQKVLVRVV